MSAPNLHVALALALGVSPQLRDDQLIAEVERLRTGRAVPSSRLEGDRLTDRDHGHRSAPAAPGRLW